MRFFDRVFIRASQTWPSTTPTASTASTVTSWKAVHPMNAITNVLMLLHPSLEQRQTSIFVAMKKVAPKDVATSGAEEVSINATLLTHPMLMTQRVSARS